MALEGDCAEISIEDRKLIEINIPKLEFVSVKRETDADYSPNRCIQNYGSKPSFVEAPCVVDTPLTSVWVKQEVKEEPEESSVYNNDGNRIDCDSASEDYERNVGDVRGHQIQNNRLPPNIHVEAESEICSIEYNLDPSTVYIKTEFPDTSLGESDADFPNSQNELFGFGGEESCSGDYAKKIAELAATHISNVQLQHYHASNQLDRTKPKEKPYKCNICQRDFVSKYNWSKHQNLNRCKQKQDLTCQVCHKEFKKSFLYKSHLLKHSEVRPYACDICNTTFKHRSSIVTHLRQHYGEKLFPCAVCNKEFTHAALMKLHLRVHTGERPFSCPKCHKRFSLKFNLKKHVTTHCREKVLTCGVCHKVFPRESRLKYHMKRHMNLKPFSCDNCDQVFSHKHNLKRHMFRKHPEIVTTE